MELNDISKHTAKKMNKLLESRYGFVVDYDKMTPAKAEKILAVINESIAQVKKSSAAHTAYKDPRYMEMLMVKESVSKYMRDYKPEMNKPGEKSAPKLQAAPKPTLRESIQEMSTGKNYQMIARAVELAAQGKAIPSKYMEAFVPVIGQITARKLTEGELGKSEVILAAKDMVDTLQDMIEDLSRMVNEELPQMMDSIRDQIGNDQAETFSGSVTETLNTLLDSVRGAREQMDASARQLAGEQVAAPMGLGGDQAASAAGANTIGEPDLSALDAGGETDDFGATDAAAGGDLELGREER